MVVLLANALQKKHDSEQASSSVPASNGVSFVGGGTSSSTAAASASSPLSSLAAADIIHPAPCPVTLPAAVLGEFARKNGCCYLLSEEGAESKHAEFAMRNRVYCRIQNMADRLGLMTDMERFANSDLHWSMSLKNQGRDRSMPRGNHELLCNTIDRKKKKNEKKTKATQS
mmetsp:Transcript_45090/g.61523  ORF Transcript_45090/g.61523 Transcript_45090/m.61523 type:complete len:171 (+) Transcript_45090:1575-2087(+)